jgi:hypothetical protein
MTMRTVYGIRDAAGELIAEHVRVDWPDGSKRLYWRLPGGDPRDGLGGLGTPDLPLYGSEYLGGYAIGATVLLVEGEKARDALAGWGVPAVATVTGSSSTPGEDALSTLLPFDVVTWEDHQDGEPHMQRSAATLLRLGGRCRRLVWTAARSKGDDAADFIARGGQRVVLDLMLRDATPWRIEAPVARAAVRPSYERHDDTRVEAARSHLLQVVEGRLGAGKKSGQSVWWCCPFHQERTPSFKVDLRQPYYRCHGCGARGDVFTFLRAIEGCEFKDVLSSLVPPAALGGIPRLGA